MFYFLFFLVRENSGYVTLEIGYNSALMHWRCCIYNFWPPSHCSVIWCHGCLYGELLRPKCQFIYFETGGWYEKVCRYRTWDCKMHSGLNGPQRNSGESSKVKHKIAGSVGTIHITIKWGYILKVFAASKSHKCILICKKKNLIKLKVAIFFFFF